MRINSKNQIENVYGSMIKTSSLQSRTPVKKENGLKQDRIEISSSAASRDELDSIKQKILNEVLKGTPSDKLRQIKSEIENGTYRVETSDIAQAMIEKNR